MADANSITVSGRLTAAPEVKMIESKSSAKGPIAIMNGSIAINVYNSRLESKSEVLFKKFKIVGSQAENLAKYRGKGDQVVLEGRIIPNNWEKDGVKHVEDVIEVRNVVFGAQAKSSSGYDGGTEATQSSTPASNGFSSISESIDDEDLPF